MLDDIRLTLDEHIAQRAPDFTDESPKPEHGRRERRSIWVSSALNDYLDFPGVGQVFAIGRQTVEVNSAKRHSETVYGVTSLSPQGRACMAPTLHQREQGGIAALVALSEVVVDLVAAHDEARFRALMQAHHYLGALPGIGETLRYVAHHRGQWLALVVFSAPALKCAARDRWIGWSFGVQFDRLHLLTNNSRFLLLPGAPRNLGSRVLSLCTRRLVSDWPARFAHPLLLVETFVDPARFHGTVYRAANWTEVGRTRGFRRQRRGYSYRAHARPKLVFVHPLCRRARATLRAAHLDPSLRHGVPKMMLSAAQMRSLPEFFHPIDDPRRRQGRRHALPTVLALATAATLCGMRGYKAISEWVDDLSPKVLERFRVRRRNGQHRAPSLSAMRSLLIRVDPAQLDAALRAWHQAHGSGDTALAIDGKALRGALDDEGRQAHVLGIVGHDSKTPLEQKKSA